jgi:1-deoxy-D-xylulose-5-phosphate reductoisomerase
VLNAANEAAVLAFLDRRIGFNDIPAVIRRTVGDHTTIPSPTLEDVLSADIRARETAEAHIKEKEA